MSSIVRRVRCPFTTGQSGWDRKKAKAKPLCTFAGEEGAAIAWFLKYWLGEPALRPGYDMRGTVNAEFDF